MQMHVGFIFNMVTEELLRESPELVLTYADPVEIIEGVQAALEAGGHTVTPLNADRYLPANLAAAQFDIVFNIATGLYGDTPPAHVPALLEYLRIPHIGAGVATEALTHHKPVMKVFLLAHHLPTPAFQVFHHKDDVLNPELRFPLIVKLPAEGGSLGLEPDSVVYNETKLREKVDFLLTTYHQGAMAEEYITGREFTVTVLGNNPPYMLPVVERLYFGDIHIQLPEPEPAMDEWYTELTGQTMDYIPVDTQSVAPADLTAAETARIQTVAIAAYQVLGCQDWARLDLRMDEHGNVYILDVNLEPAIAPEYAVARAAQAAGWTYKELINRILGHAIERYPHLAHQSVYA